MLQPTTPFRSVEDINSAIKLLNEHKTDSVISVVDVGATHPARTKYLRWFLIDPPFCEEKKIKIGKNLIKCIYVMEQFI